MRQRITLFHQVVDSIDPKNIKLTKDAFQLTGLKAAREDKISFSLEDLPVELRLVLKQSHELHIRYVSQEPYESVNPLFSRLSPGLHVLYSPQRHLSDTDLLCPLLRKLFGTASEKLCITPEISFTKLPTQRFQHSTALQYYLPHTQLTPHTHIDYILSLCTPSDKLCVSRVELLRSASYIDIDYDTIAHTLSLSAYWPTTIHSSLNLTTPSSHNSRLEVGLLSSEPPTEPEELSLGGFLTSLGDGEDENNQPSPVRFSFPARHHPHNAKFSTEFLFPTGLHPTLQINISDARPPETESNCRLHAHLTLPGVVFADKYQFQDQLFLKSHNLSALRYITNPVDLEAPDYAVVAWGSSLLLEAAPPGSMSNSSSKISPFTATVPLHLRYLKPSESGHRTAFIPIPVLFWACTADEGSKFSINPFDRVNLVYDGLFGPRTMFYHLSPQYRPSKGVKSDGAYLKVDVPVLRVDENGWLGAESIEIGTAVVILLGFSWVLWVLGKVWIKSGYGRLTKVKEEKKTL